MAQGAEPRFILTWQPGDVAAQADAELQRFQALVATLTGRVSLGAAQQQAGNPDAYAPVLECIAALNKCGGKRVAVA